MLHSVHHTPNLLGFSAIQFGSDWRMPWHVHEQNHEMIFILSGRITVETQQQTVSGRLGEALVYPQGVGHGEWAVGPAPGWMYCLAWAGQRGPAWPLVCADRRGRMALLLEWMQELSPAQSEEDRQTLNILLAALLSEYAGSRGTGDDERLAAARRYAQEHLAEPLCLDDLARVACLSRFHFATLFRAQLGITPMDWVRRARVEAARTLLLTSTLPLSAIAPLVGLHDEFHLSRVFRRVTGRPASLLRQEAGRTGPAKKLPSLHDG